MDTAENDVHVRYMETKDDKLYSWGKKPSTSWEKMDSIVERLPKPSLAVKSTNTRQFYEF